MHLAVTDLEPEASAPLKGGGLLDLSEPEKPAVEGARFRDRVGWNRYLHVIDAEDHPHPFAALADWALTTRSGK
jgi:hypothetical protein